METLKQATFPIANYKQTISYDSERIIVEDATGRHELAFRGVDMAHVYPLFFLFLRLVPVRVVDCYLSSGAIEVKLFNLPREAAEAIVASVLRANPGATIDRQPLARGLGNFNNNTMRSLGNQVQPGVPHASLPQVFMLSDLFWYALFLGLLGYGLMRLFS